MPFCTKEIGKEITSKLFWKGLGWKGKRILANVVPEAQQQLNPAAVVANFVALFVSTGHIEQRATCIVSYSVYYHHSYPAAHDFLRIFTGVTSTCFLPYLARAFGVGSYSSSYSWVARDVIIFENPKLESYQSYYLHQAWEWVNLYLLTTFQRRNMPRLKAGTF